MQKNMIGIMGAVAVLVGFVFAGCDTGNNGSGNSGGTTGGSSQLTLHNLPQGLDRSGVMVVNRSVLPADMAQLVAWMYSPDAMIHPEDIEKEGPTFRLVAGTGGAGYSHTGPRLVSITNYDQSNPSNRVVVADFVNGSATVNWNTMVDPDALPPINGDDAPVELRGSWRNAGGGGYDITAKTIKFVISGIPAVSYDIRVTGNTATTSASGLKLGTFNWAVNGNTLTISGAGDASGIMNGTYTKQERLSQRWRRQ